MANHHHHTDMYLYNSKCSGSSAGSDSITAISRRLPKLHVIIRHFLNPDVSGIEKKDGKRELFFVSELDTLCQTNFAYPSTYSIVKISTTFTLLIITNTKYDRL